jgi:hypothetical protein
MGDITITVSEKELKLLLKHVALANWMLEAYKTEPDDEGRENEAFYHKILTLAHENGLKEGIIFDEDLKDFFLTDEKDQEYHQFVDLYNEEFFWEHLEDELAKRDLLEKHEKKAIEGMDTNKWFDLLGKEVEKYYQEFAKNGVKNLRIVK